MSFNSVRRFLRCLTILLLAGIVWPPTTGSLQAWADPTELDDDQDFERWQPGVLSTREDKQGRAVTTIDRQLFIDTQRHDSTAQLESVIWQGRLLTLVPGSYRLHFFLQGDIVFSLNDQILLEATVDSAQWLSTEAFDSEYGYQKIELRFQPSGETALLKSHWEGPSFRLEPIPSTALFHDAGDTPQLRLKRGRELVDALNCAACHDIEGHRNPAHAADLTHSKGNISPAWLVRWIRDTRRASIDSQADSSASETSRMPSFDISEQDARAMATVLIGSGKSTASSHFPAASGNAEQGAVLFNTVGCLACHRTDFETPRGLYDGSPLGSIATKRPASFFSRWLKDPAALNANHRMPIFPLTKEERSDLAAYLATLGGDAEEEDFVPLDLSDLSTQEDGVLLLKNNRCNACHELPLEDEPGGSLKPVALPSQIDWADSCLSGPDERIGRPGYELSEADAEAVRAFLSTDRSPLVQPAAGERVLSERNCLACHARDWHQGIAAKLPALTAAHPELAVELPTLAPPSLTGIGDKLTDKALAQAITTKAPARRPWLRVRMPQFNLAGEELQDLVDYFVASDRIPQREVAEENKPNDTALELAGRRLVTADGFGCTSCHQIGSSIPQKVALNAQGTNLSLLGNHIRRTWFDRWVRNPARIVPKMEMPSIQLAVHGVLDENLDDQLNALWHVLNQEGFEPPPPGALRIVRSSNTGDSDERANVLTDVLRAEGRQFIKPLLVGLPNRHSFLFDFDTHQLAGWWIGDTAAQRTEGKSWYWEASGTPVLSFQPSTAELQLVYGDSVYQPEKSGQFVSEFDKSTHITGGLQWNYRLRIATSSPQPALLHVNQTVTACSMESDDGHLTGFERTIQVAGVPKGSSLHFQPLPNSASARITMENDGLLASLSTENSQVQLRLGSTSALRFANSDDSTLVIVAPADSEGEVNFKLQYLTDLPVDQFVVPSLPAFPVEPVALDVIPGYDAVQLPLAADAMPTGLAWRADGTLVASSLKGRVWQAWDSDNDGLEDHIEPFSDELAAPYGVAIGNPQAIDCINKYGLLRLWDRDGDGRAESTEVLASGWGHTSDYHDWAVGLPRDDQGRYYIALPCQQDDRTLAAAELRGTALRLVPREPSEDDPQSFAIETICAGLRFPMGLALSRSGDLFATDNQGNYNPFNELNWLVEGARYGFINKLERGDKQIPAGRFSAIEIPHPWTRSVNGICFLDTPVALREGGEAEHFGPFEGHLLGCEYDTRRLIRMSLHPVDGIYQGAAYPFTRTPNEEEPALQGPLVCAVAPDGDIYVGNIRDSGWGGGTNVGSFVRIRPKDDLPPGIAEVRATSDGFEIDFTAPVDSPAGQDLDHYHVESYRRKSTPAYGGDDMDRREERIDRVRLSKDRLQATLTLPGLREGFVYAIRVSGLGEAFFPAEAYYTLRKIPASTVE